MHFQAPREIVEHPALLVEALQAHKIPIELGDTPYQGFGNVGEIDMWLGVHQKRFRANLSLRIWEGRAVRDRVKEMLTKLRTVAAIDPTEREHEIHELLRALRQQREKVTALRERVSTILAEFEIVSIDSPLDAEIQFAMEHYGQIPETHKLVRRIREHQQDVASSVAAQRFDDASYHRDKRERLLDSLYDLCTA